MPFCPNVYNELTLNGVTYRVKNHQVTKVQSFPFLRVFVVRKRINHQDAKTQSFLFLCASAPSW